jgi:hypothetical protein
MDEVLTLALAAQKKIGTKNILVYSGSGTAHH